MYQLEGGGDHHQDHGSLFLPPSIELTLSTIHRHLATRIDQRQDSPFSSCPGALHHNGNHQWQSFCVPSALQSISLHPLGILAYICDTTVLHTRSASLHFSTGFSLWECSCSGLGKTRTSIVVGPTVQTSFY